ncbi:MAG: hypothetical protein L3J39_10895 [Verrucomicrobiales bacterium]|nr:hypothetical protein [Verrucomicrobiales bacterium]
MPGVFDRKTGDFKFKSQHSWRKDAGGVIGGTQALLADKQIYAWGAHHILAMNQKNGKVGFGWFAGQQMAIKDDAAFVADGKNIARIDRQIYAVEPDADKVATARQRLTRAGYYGNRITIHHGSLADIPYPNYFANLVVSDTLVKTGNLPSGFTAQDIAHCVKPLGGMIALGPLNEGKNPSPAQMPTLNAVEIFRDE